MDILRIIFCLGLVSHKAVWELMKKEGVPGNRRTPSPSLLKRFFKYLKVVALAFLVVQTLFLDLFPLSNEPAAFRTVGLVIYLLGLGIAIAGRLQLGKNWANLEDYQVLRGQALVTSGIYRYIRHPIYTGDILLLIGLELALNSWLVIGIAIPLFVIIRQALAEEALLAQRLAGYEEYRKQTKRFVPFLI